MSSDIRMPGAQPITPDRAPGTTAEDDAWIDALLREDAAATPYIDDAGFSLRALSGLPAQAVNARHRWIVPAMGVLGFVVGLAALSGGPNLSLSLADLLSLESPSLHKLFAVVLPLGLLYWLGVVAALQEC